MKQVLKDILYFIKIIFAWESPNDILPSDPHKLKINLAAKKVMNVLAVISIIFWVGLLIMAAPKIYDKASEIFNNLTSSNKTETITPSNSSSSNVEEKVITPTYQEPQKSPTVVKSFSVQARVYHFVGTAMDGFEKPTSNYVTLTATLYDNGNVYCNGLPVRYCRTEGYDYECNEGNIIYKFNTSEIY